MIILFVLLLDNYYTSPLFMSEFSEKRIAVEGTARVRSRKQSPQQELEAALDITFNELYCWVNNLGTFLMK